VANALIPGYRDPKTGKVRHRAMMPYNRVWVIPKNLPEKVKEAAFYVALHVSHSDYSFYSTPDLLCGMDPYMYSHYTDENAWQYTKPNPLRGTAPDWPTNEPCFPAFEEARKHLYGGLAATIALCWIFIWNEFLIGYLLSGKEVITYPAFLPSLRRGMRIMWNQIAAISILAAIPSILILFFFRKYIIRLYFR